MMSVNPVFKRFLFIFALFWVPPAVVAADMPRDCVVQPELIFEMQRAEYGAYNVWDAVYGEMNLDERFVSGVVLDNGNVAALGEVTGPGKPERSLVLAEFDGRGRKVWEILHNVVGLAGVKKLLATAEGFAALGVVKGKNGRSGVWLGFFGKDGKLLSQKNISGGGEDLVPEDFIPQVNGKGFLLSVSAGDEKSGIFHSALYHLNGKGEVADKHGYMPGLDNRIFGLSAAGKDFYMASGYLRGEDGRMTGWILKLNKDGSLIWQRQYPRGSKAQINRILPMVKDYVLAAGETRPKGAGNSAAWVMMIDGNTGNVEWQRYYTGEMDQSAGDMLVNMEGLASVMVRNTRPPRAPEEFQDYVRLLTVNERGVLFISDEYFNAAGAQGFQMIGGRAGERIILGGTDVVYKIEPKPGEPVETLRHGWDGWIVAAAPMDSFPDPCLAGEMFAP